MSDTLWSDDQIRIQRDTFGNPRIHGPDQRSLWWGLGFCHATDRGLQMLFTRVLGRGELSLMTPTDEALELDRFFRRVNWRDAQGEVAQLTNETRALCEAYCDGANVAFTRRIPWELKLLGYRHRPWTIDDVVLLTRIVGFVAMAELQADLKRFLIELVQGGVGRSELEELFGERLGDYDEELIRKVQVGPRLVPESLFFQPGVVRMSASNNWVVSGRRSRSGKPLFANDPHLEVNRLPSVWYEAGLRTPQRWGLGATMPGLPALLVGRTAELAWGATYSCMDAVDSWIERCRDGEYERDGSWERFQTRVEVIERKGKDPVECTFYQNSHGVLAGDPEVEGLYLATRWSGADAGASAIEGFAAMWKANTVAEGMRDLGRCEVAINWVFADRGGDIGYQMSGVCPKRREGFGMLPQPGWDPRNDWQGYADPEQLPRCVNPKEGFIVTANHDLNHLGEVEPINACAGRWRPDRIAQLLSHDNLGIDDMQRVQDDLYSLHAEEFMERLRPLLPNTPAAALLRDWDFRYDADSRGAFLFEKFHRALRREVFGHRLPLAVIDHVTNETNIFVAFFSSFDQVMLAEESIWFDGRSREEIWRAAADTALSCPPERWGKGRQVFLKHLLFGGRLPRWLGFDRGPITMKGGKATPCVGEIYRTAGRETTFAPSLRMVADMADDSVHTALAGGPSDRRFSRRYASGLDDWERGRYRELKFD